MRSKPNIMLTGTPGSGKTTSEILSEIRSYTMVGIINSNATSSMKISGYTGAKLTNNIECEIFGVLLEEAKDSYKEEIVMAMKNDSVDDMNRNVATITEGVRNWSSKN